MNVHAPVEIGFDCLPLRQVGRLDPPLDAPPETVAFWHRVGQAIHRHGAERAYYVYRGECVFHLTNDPAIGLLRFQFEGTVLTDGTDQRVVGAQLDVELAHAACDWLTEPVVDWFRETVCQAVKVEFQRFIEAGDLDAARRRVAQLAREADDQGGFLGMYL